MQFEARIGDRPCVLPLIETQSVRAMRRPLQVHRAGAPPVDVSIQPFTAVCTNALSLVQVTVTNLPQNDAVVMRFGRMSGTGEAKFYEQGSGQLLSEVRITGSATLTIKGIAASSTTDNMNLNALLASTLNEPFPRVLDAEAFTVLDFTFEQEGSTVIEAINNYSENTTLKITVAPSSFVQGWKVRFMENGTGIYDGRNGATDLTAKPVVSLSNGTARLTVKSVSNSTDAAGPRGARVFVHLLDASSQFICTSGDLEIDQWVDADNDMQIDWLIAQSQDLLNCFKSRTGIVGEVARSVTGLGQTLDPVCGATEIFSTFIRISPVCQVRDQNGNPFGPNLHRLNTNCDLSNTVIHEARHAWQNTLLGRSNLGTSCPPSGPSGSLNDSDLDGLPEATPQGSSADGIRDDTRNQSTGGCGVPLGDCRADPQNKVYCLTERDAQSFGNNQRRACHSSLCQGG